MYQSSVHARMDERIYHHTHTTGIITNCCSALLHCLQLDKAAADAAEYKAGFDKYAADAAEYKAGYDKYAADAAEYKAGFDKYAADAAEYKAGYDKLLADTTEQKAQVGACCYAQHMASILASAWCLVVPS
jgi:hypothetical protein